MILKNVLPSTISIEAPTGLATTVISKNTKLPAKELETIKVTMITENQKQVIVNSYEG